ncbi:kelch-like protein 7 [Drosophila tropicalis]|uniref:kelch-like protein 7 n=1 Tax=Drosophila tropicalis TaxID=46794 RepID=UPI0035AB8078
MMNEKTNLTSSGATELQDLNTYDINNATIDLVIESCLKSGDFDCEQLPPKTLDQIGFKPWLESVEFDFSWEKSQLGEIISKLLFERQGTEVQVHVEDRVFDCHLTVLQFYTEYFKQFKCKDIIKISAPQVKAVGFEKVYEWMIDDKATPQREHIVELYMAAAYFNLPDLIKQLWCCFDSTTLFSECEAFKVYLEAVPYDVPILQNLMISRIQKFFLLAVTTEEFLQLEHQHVHQLLDSSNVCVNSEMEVYMSALRWLNHDWEQRKEHAVLIMGAVRFSLMPPWFTTSLKAKQSDYVQQELVDNPEILNMINLGLSYSVTIEFMDKNSPQTEQLAIQQAAQRQWIFDEMTSHHHQYECPNWLYLDFKLFNQFLLRIISEGSAYVNRLIFATSETRMSCCCNALNPKQEKERLTFTPITPLPSPSAGLMAMPNAPPPSSE